MSEELELLTKKVEELGAPLTERRKGLLDGILKNRLRHFTMVLEDLVDPHNISAIIRTSEVFGFQDVHVIEELLPYRVNKSVLKGSFKWLNLFRYKKRANCLKRLREQGYQIAIASTNTENSVFDLDLSKPTAFYMGSELQGNHPDTLEAADVHFKIPQYGITESMNVSVAAGVLMANLDTFLRGEGREKYTLDEIEKMKLKHEWYERTRFGLDKNSPLKDL